MTHAKKGGTGTWVCLRWQQSRVHSEARTAPPPPPTLLPASRPVPCSDTAVINALGKDDDNNDHN